MKKEKVGATQMNKILLLGGGLQGLSFGESLYKLKGFELSVVSEEYDIRESIFFKNIFKGKVADYDSVIGQIFQQEHYDLIVPMGDTSVAYLSEHQKQIENSYHTKCAVVDHAFHCIVADKGRFMAFCKENGFPHPLTASLTETSLEKAAQEVGFPSLIKPDHSVGARGITRVHSMEELRSQYLKVSQKYGPCTLQEYIDNPDYYYNVMMYRDSQGQITSAVIKIVRKYPIEAGSSSCCISVNNPELAEICQGVMDKLNWVGMADFDVLQRKDTLEYKIIEVNPRVPASLRAAFVSGINFPEIIVRDALGMEYQQGVYKPGKVLRYLGIDLLWFLKSPNRFKSSPSWFHFRGKDIYYQDIIKSDASTWYSWLIKGFQKFFH